MSGGAATGLSESRVRALCHPSAATDGLWPVPSSSPSVPREAVHGFCWSTNSEPKGGSTRQPSGPCPQLWAGQEVGKDRTAEGWEAAAIEEWAGEQGGRGAGAESSGP